MKLIATPIYKEHSSDLFSVASDLHQLELFMLQGPKMGLACTPHVYLTLRINTLTGIHPFLGKLLIKRNILFYFNGGNKVYGGDDDYSYDDQDCFM